MAFVSTDAKDPSAVGEIHYTLFASAANDGSISDNGYLQGRTLNSTAINAATIAISPAGGLTTPSHSVIGTSISIKGITYPPNTVVQIALSGGVDGTDYDVTIPLTLSTGETDERSFTVPCRNR